MSEDPDHFSSSSPSGKVLFHLSLEGVFLTLFSASIKLLHGSPAQTKDITNC